MAAAVHKLLHPLSHSHHEHKKDDAQSQPQQHPEQQASSTPTSPHMDRARADEKRTLAHWEERKEPLTPGEIQADPGRKLVGHSSDVLRQDDFELIKTLGTGAEKPACPVLNRTADHRRQERLRGYGSYGSVMPPNAIRATSSR